MSWPQAVLLDFYGTVVEEDDHLVSELCAEISDSITAMPVDPRTVGAYWSELFTRVCADASGPAFATQRELERRSLRQTIRHFGSAADEEALSGRLFAYWQRPVPFPDTAAFLREIACPICIVSDIDRTDIETAMAHLDIKVDLLVTSQDACAYKPRPEPFLLALGLLELPPDQVVHIGDSLTRDVAGANALRIPAAWVNRTGRTRPPTMQVTYEVTDLTSLHQALATAPQLLVDSPGT
ncbi:conserved hypothetical protein [Frankia canadensis]|uniref:Uncharacterized protein n=1 Tax=Frankia canadensis TaxID=1836972 RepID=A0A2I2L093_9ACTN|nr:HAD family hydrolase [Frankia canadensis]SNQ51328.1 conserved hypothetical protein [Frankia canadensis]SOU58618.1 conserved hypothetical protein [Frankia canadensis]